MHKQHPQTAYRKYAILIGTIFENCDKRRNHYAEQYYPHPFCSLAYGLYARCNLRTALYTYLMAKHDDGTFILRIEDTDQGRYVEGAVDVIYNTLRETGLLWDEGPDIGGPVGPYVQSERMGMFKQYAEQLVAEGKAYYCFCTEERLEALHAEQRAHGEMTHYDGCCRDLPREEVEKRLAAGEPYVIRQKIPREGVTGFDDMVYGHIEVNNSEMDDQILIRPTVCPPTTSQMSWTTTSWASPTSSAAASICPPPRSITCCIRLSAGTSPTTSTALRS